MGCDPEHGLCSVFQLLYLISPPPVVGYPFRYYFSPQTPACYPCVGFDDFLRSRNVPFASAYDYHHTLHFPPVTIPTVCILRRWFI